MPLLRLRTLGTTALLRDDVLLGGSAAQKRRLALLAVLAVAGDRGISRDRLAALLWPERDEEQARHSLSQWLYTTRRELNADGLILGTADLRLNPQCIASDVSDFERALAAGELEPAIASYAGPFLDGFHVAGTAEFDRWADLERGRLSALYHGALEKLACRREDAGDYQAAAETWRRLAALDPYNGRVSLSLMRALSASGDAAGALTHARVHATLLKEELGAEAQPEVLAYAAELRVAPPAPRTVRGVPPAPVAEPRAPEAPPAAGPAHVAAPAAPEPAATRRARPAGAAVLAAGLLLVATIAAGYRALPQDWRAGVRTLAGRPDATFVSRRIVVVPFDNRTGDSTLQVLGEMAAEMLAGALAQTGEFEVVDVRAARVADHVVDRIPWPFRPRDRLVALAAETQAAYILSGSYYRAGEMLRVVAQVTDAAGRKVPRPPVTMTGSVRQPWALVDSVTRRALPMAIALVDTAWTGATVAVTSPPSADAYRELSAAWEAYFAANVPEAIVRARRAAALDTGFMAPLALQAHVHAEDRDWARVDSLVEAIQRHEARLSPLERAVASTYQAAARGDLAGQLVAALDVVRHAPASPETRTYAARVAVNSNRPAVALNVTAPVDPKRGVMLARPWYWNWTTAAYHLLGRHDVELRQAEAGASQFPTNVAALANLGRARAVQGDVAALRALLARLPSPHSRLRQPRWKLAFDWTRELRAHGHPAEARDLLGVLLEQLAAAPDDEGHWRDRFTAVALGDLQRWGEAHQRWQQLAAREPANLDVQGHLAVAAAQAGDPATARRIDDALARWPSRYTLGRHTLWRARIAAALGERERAVSLVETALAQGHARFFDQTGGQYDEPELHADPALLGLRGMPAYDALLAPRP